MKQDKQVRLMGIINATPDSFSGDGVLSVEAITQQARDFLNLGADILDIGGESTRPNSAPVSESQELARTIPAIKAIHKSFPDAVISIDTSKAEVASQALQAGARIVNDVTALSDPAMAEVVASHNVPIILMHNRAKSATGESYDPSDYNNVVQDVKTSLKSLAETAQQQNIKSDNIILDAGIGFGKSVQQNMQLIKHSAELKSLGYPLLLGASRKSFIGKVLDCEVDDRLAGSVACAALAILTGGIDIIRVHDVAFMANFMRMLEALQACDD